MKHLVFALAAFFCLGAWTAEQAPPAGTKTLYSQDFEFHGTCNAQEQVYSWWINAGPPHPDSFIHPWLSTDISIRGVEIVATQPPVFNWMVGNNADGDAMLKVGPGDYHEVQWFPADTAFEFPSAANAAAWHYIDLHGSCAGGGAVTVTLTLYYTQNP